MKKRVILGIAAGVFLISAALVAADVSTKPVKGIVIGQAVEISTFAMLGGGEENMDAMVARCEQGFPVGIIEEETGKLWVCVFRNNAPASGLETANSRMQPLMGKKVTAQGFKYESQGVSVLRMSVISEY